MTSCNPYLLQVTQKRFSFSVWFSFTKWGFFSFSQHTTRQYIKVVECVPKENYFFVISLMSAQEHNHIYTAVQFTYHKNSMPQTQNCRSSNSVVVTHSYILTFFYPYSKRDHITPKLKQLQHEGIFSWKTLLLSN